LSIQAAVYLESVSGRIAATIHNCSAMFDAENFTIVPRNAFRGDRRQADIANRISQIQIIYERDPSSSPESGGELHSGASAAILKVTVAMRRVSELTYFQSEDPV
jgi:hypothetical protein